MMIRLMLSAIAVGLLVGGCAITRDEVDVRVPPSSNAGAGAAYRVPEVRDARIFQIAPPSPNIPSLKNNEVEDRSITSRAVARKRNAYGQALGDLLLPEGRTVAQLTAEALTKALRERGYRVLAPGEAGYEAARPLQAEIQQFWAWMTPGFAQISLEFQARVSLAGGWPMAQGTYVVEGYAKNLTMAGTTSEWLATLNAGIESLVKNTAAALRDSAVRVSEVVSQ